MLILSRRNFFLFFITIIVIGLAVAFYFWESYLLSHYLGGYDEYGLPIQRSYPGFTFFFHAWPLWIFPLSVVLIIMVFVHVYALEKVRQRRRTRMEELENIENKIDLVLSMQDELKNKLGQDKKEKKDKHWQEQYQKLENKLTDLQVDYQRSLDFIEKLLEKIPSE